MHPKEINKNTAAVYYCGLRNVWIGTEVRKVAKDFAASVYRNESKFEMKNLFIPMCLAVDSNQRSLGCKSNAIIIYTNIK